MRFLPSEERTGSTSGKFLKITVAAFRSIQLSCATAKYQEAVEEGGKEGGFGFETKLETDLDGDDGVVLKRGD